MCKFRLVSFIWAVIIVFTLVSPNHTAAQRLNDATPSAADLLRWSSAPDLPDRNLQQILQRSVQNLPGDWAIAVKRMDSGQMAEVSGNDRFVSASLYKLDVLLALASMHAQGDIGYSDWITATLADNIEDYTNGDPGIDPGIELTVQRAAELMIDESNNTAAAMLIRTVGGQKAINSVLQNYGLNRTIFDPNNDNLTSADDMMRYFEMLYSARLVHADESRWMLDMLLRQELNFLIPDNLPDGLPVAHKTGNLLDLMHDAGIVYAPNGPFVIVVLAQNLDTEDTARAQTPKIAKAVYDYFNKNSYPLQRSFEQTGHTVSGPFLGFWNTWGGLSQFGYPITDAISEDGMTVQYFERARFELHSEDKVNPVQLTRLGGNIVSRRSYNTSPATPLKAGDNQFFEATAHNVSKSFLSYWRNHGGLTVFGYPLTERFDEVSAIDGNRYTVQYFERARFELHVDSDGNGYVLLGPLGVEELAANRPAIQQEMINHLFERVTSLSSV